MPRVSVIIATYNRPHLLPRAVESARGAGTDVEIVVVDDASAEATAEACRALKGVRYVRVERNQRLGGARNLGILASSGELISFLDDDDLRLPGSLDAQAEALASAPEAGMVYGQALLGDVNSAPTGGLFPTPCPQGDIFWELLERNFIPCPSTLFRRSTLFRIGLPAASLPGIEDWDLWIRLAELFPVLAVERPVAVYRKASADSGQLTSDAAGMARRIAYAHREHWLKLPRALEAPRVKRQTARRRFTRNMANHLVWEAGRDLKGGRLLTAQKNLATALRLHPLGLLHRATRPSNVRFLLSNVAGSRGAKRPTDQRALSQGQAGNET